MFDRVRWGLVLTGVDVTITKLVSEENRRMTKRLIISSLLICAVALSSSSCKKWRGKSGARTAGTGTEVLQPGGTGEVGLGDIRPAEFKAPGVVGQFDNVLFAYDSAQVEDVERAKIEAVAEFSRSNPHASLVLEGHCDERGSNEYNMSLGERRALAVRAYLMNLGVDTARLQTKSYGEERPKDPGHNEEAWRLNRRVEFLVVQP
jgi:peptidoglycan-associated lipoprotein